MRSTSLFVQGTISNIPIQARRAQAVSSSLRERDKDKKRGPTNSTVTARPNGIRCMDI